MRGDVMLWGPHWDEPLTDVRAELARRGHPHVFLEQHQAVLDYCDGKSSLGLEPDCAHLEFTSRRVELAAIAAVFLRPHDGREIVRHYRGALPNAVALENEVAEFERHLFAWADCAETLSVNRPTAMASNASKPYQSELIRTQGFAIPETLVTTSPDAAREFVARHESVICKSVSGQRSMASTIDESDAARLADIGCCATQFQERIEGTDYRVHVIGERLFACEIECDADDYRFLDCDGKRLAITPCELPEEIASRCRALATFLKLPLSGIDLRRTDDGVWYCFEVNAAPAFSYFQRKTGQPLTAAVADLLVSGARGRFL